MTLEWLPAAERDFDAIIDFIAADNPPAAIEQGDEIQQQIANLQKHPSLGRLGRVKGTRELVIVRTPFIAAYRIKNQRLQILRILHGTQPWPKSF